MKKYIILFLFSTIAVNTSFAQVAKKDSLMIQNRELATKLSEQSERITKLTEQLNLSDTAGKVIDWSTMILSLFVIILGFAGWFAGNKFAKIDELKKELENLLGDFKHQLTREQESIMNLKKEFEKEKETSIQVLFPLIEGQLFAYQGDMRKAIDRYREVQNIIPEHPVVINRLNKLLIETGRTKEAISNLELLVKKFPDNTKLTYRLAQAYRRFGQLDVAELTIKDVAISTNNASALYEYGTIKLLKGEFKEAEEYLIKSNKNFILESGSPRDWVYTNLSLAQFLQGKAQLSLSNIKKAEEILLEQLERTPKNPQILGNLGLGLMIENINNSEYLEYFKKSTSVGLPIMIASSYKEKIEMILKMNGENAQIQTVIDLLESHIKNIDIKTSEYSQME